MEIGHFLGVLLFVIISVKQSLTEEDKSTDVYLKSVEWLKQTGWLSKRDSKRENFHGLSEQQLRMIMWLPLKRMKSFYFGANQNGDLNEEALAFMNEPRCGIPDVPIPADNAAGRRRKRYSYLGNQRWSKFPLTIGYNNYTTDMPIEVQEEVALTCAQKWADVSGLSFKFVRDQIANIHISFVTMRKKNGEVEGRFGIIGKAVSPLPFRKPPSSWIRMDESEVWKARVSAEHSDRRALSFEEGLCHEIGHTLGLSHSNDKKAIMYPIVGFRNKDTELGEDDIAGIQSLYGKPEKPTTTTRATTTTRSTTTRSTTTPSTTTRSTTTPSTTTRSTTTRSTTTHSTTTRSTTTRSTTTPSTTTSTTTSRPSTTTSNPNVMKLDYCMGFRAGYQRDLCRKFMSVKT